MIEIIKSSKILIVKDFWSSSGFWSSECFVARSTHSVIFNSMILISISLIKALQNFDFVIASAKLMFSSIHLISAIFLLSYDCLRNIRSIIKRFSLVVSSLTKQSKKDFESVRRINDREICSIRSHRQIRFWAAAGVRHIRCAPLYLLPLRRYSSSSQRMKRLRCFLAIVQRPLADAVQSLKSRQLIF